MNSKDIHQTELAGAPAKGDMPRESLADRIKPFILIFLLVVLPIALFHVFTQYMYVCRIPAGATVIDYTVTPRASSLGEYLCGLPWIKDKQQIQSYLQYWYYIIPESATDIHNYTFANSNGLRPREIVIPGNVRSIGYCAFEDCASLKKLVIQEGVEFIDPYAFSGCSGLEEVILPASAAKRIGTWATFLFQNCSGLRKVVLPDGIRRIPACMFKNCASLTEINIPDSVTEIGYWAFIGCRNLKQVTLGANVKSIGKGAFSGTGCQLVFPDGLPDGYRYQDGILYNGSTLVSCVAPPDGLCVIPPDVKEFSDFAFALCTGLTEIRMPEGVEVIPWGAFSGCTALKHIELPKSLKEIGPQAFAGCNALPKLKLPLSVQVHSDAFPEQTAWPH